MAGAVGSGLRRRILIFSVHDPLWFFWIFKQWPGANCAVETMSVPWESHVAPSAHSSFAL